VKEREGHREVEVGAGALAEGRVDDCDRPHAHGEANQRAPRQRIGEQPAHGDAGYLMSATKKASRDHE